MDIYDTQTLGIMVFGGFMVISAIGIALVSTFSMKETSYEEALAKQRRELGKMQPPRTEKKKKDKASEKKNRGKKKEEKPNGKIPEPESVEDAPAADPVPEPASAPVVVEAIPEPVAAFEPKPTPPPAPADTQPKAAAAAPSPVLVESSPAPSPKEKKKKKVAKVEPASNQPAPVMSAPVKSAPAPAPVKSAPAPAPVKSAPAPAPVKSAPAPAPVKSAPVKSAPAPAPVKSAPAPAPVKSAPAPAPVKSAPAPAPVKSAPVKSAPAPAKSVSAPAKSAAAQVKPSQPPAKSSPTLKHVPVLEAVTKEVPVMAVPPVGSQQTATVAAKAQEPKKKASKKKTEPAAAVDSADAPLYLPYKTLVSTLSSMVFSEGEAQRLIEILSEKAGIIQDTWHMATQKGDPVVLLKKQLDEREKQLAAEQEDAAAAKNRLRELSKELSAEKSKVSGVENRLSSQLNKREVEMIALQARMQASYQDHVAQTQRLSAKVLSLQDQLEKGPNAQLARVQQENSILRDALNQATSQAESKQNAELAKLRQECAKLTKELGEKMESLQADEHIRRGLETKVSTTEKQLSLLQASHAESEQALQRRLEEVCEELRIAQSSNSSLQASMEKAQQDSSTLSELQPCMGRMESELRERSAQVDALTAQLEQTQAEKSQLEQQVASINSLLEASQTKNEEADNPVNAAELDQLKLSEDAGLVASLQDELNNLKEEMEQLKHTAQSDNSAELALLQSSLSERDALVTSLQEELREAREKSKAIDDGDLMVQLTSFQTEAKETLQTLFPQIPLETEQSNWLQDFTQKAQEALALSQQSQESQTSTELPALLEKLKEAEDSHGSLQAECEQYRTVLAETEGMLKDLQKSVEEEELVWKSKMADSVEQLRVALEKACMLEAAVESLKTENQSVEQLKEQVMLLEAQLEKQSESATSDAQGNSEEMEQLKLQLSECQSQLDSAQTEAQAHKEELAQVREQLSEVTMRAQREQNGPAEAQPSQVRYELSQTTEKLHGEEAQRQQLSEEFEQAQKTVSELEAQLDLLRAAGDSPQADTEDVAQLKERLEKEKKLSKDLGQAATKLQQLLKAAQEQLTKERDTVRTLQEHLEGKGEYVELKEGTSV
ncbi:ribosome-binding protein 1a [Diretmus argenteus]